MDYKKHYYALMKKAKHRSIPIGYTETHHILPRCLGGKDVKINLVELTPEEHYVAHLLLVKMHPGNIKLTWAAMQMTQGTRNNQRSNKIYGWLRRRLAEELSKKFKGSKHTDEAKAKMSASRLGVKRKPHSEETKRKMSLASKGRKKSEAHRVAIQIAAKKRGGHPLTPENKKKLMDGWKNCDKSFTRKLTYRTLKSVKAKEAWARLKAKKNNVD